jgi:hypothetical protein
MTNNTKVFSSWLLSWSPKSQDNIVSFDNYIPFGGWSKTAAKLFADQTICRINVLLYYEP